MSNIFSQSTSPAFKRQAIDQYFIQPMFMAEEKDFIYLSTVERKGVLGMTMKKLPDEQLFMFAYNSDGLLTTTMKEIKYVDKRWNSKKYSNATRAALDNGYDFELSRALKDWEKGKDFPSYFEQFPDKEDETDKYEGTPFRESERTLLDKYGF